MVYRKIDYTLIVSNDMLISIDNLETEGREYLQVFVSQKRFTHRKMCAFQCDIYVTFLNQDKIRPSAHFIGDRGGLERI